VEILKLLMFGYSVADNVVDVNGKYHTYSGNARYFRCSMP